MVADPFSVNKAKVRELDFTLIKRHLKNGKGQLRYLGLPAASLIELATWESYFSHFSAIERGRPERGFVEQHRLLLTAMRLGLSDRLVLLRGEMDDILLKGRDEFQNPIEYPFDVVSLDYSGGLFYRDDRGKSRRIESIHQLLTQQADRDKSFLLFMSTNLDNVDHGEVKRVLSDINRELGKMGVDANKAIGFLVAHKMEEARLKVYVPYLIKSLADKWYRCEFNKPVFYSGNLKTRMMHFAFWLKRTAQYSAGKPSPSDLIDIVNLAAFFCETGNLTETNFDIPQVAV